VSEDSEQNQTGMLDVVLSIVYVVGTGFGCALLLRVIEVAFQSSIFVFVLVALVTFIWFSWAALAVAWFYLTMKEIEGQRLLTVNVLGKAVITIVFTVIAILLMFIALLVPSVFYLVILLYICLWIVFFALSLRIGIPLSEEDLVNEEVNQEGDNPPPDD
jgi:hypothetical protein